MDGAEYVHTRCSAGMRRVQIQSTDITGTIRDIDAKGGLLVSMSVVSTDMGLAGGGFNQEVQSVF